MTKHFNICWRQLLPGFALLLLAGSTIAGTPRPQADLSISVLVAPSAFLPNDIGTVTLTVHNDGPEDAGVGYPSAPIIVQQKAFIGFTPAPQAPYVMPGLGQGCNIYSSVLGPGVDFTWGLIHQFFLPGIPAGESVTCSYAIQFRPAPFQSFNTYWFVYSGLIEDPNPANDQVNYTFVAGVPYVAPTPVPFLNRLGLILLVCGIVTFVRRRSSRELQPVVQEAVRS
ncbi:MAG: hypothetical protein ABIP56_00380 [Dokdonella sp.]